jgi:hypothetical protein
VNFAEIKSRVKITDVCLRYGVKLRFNGDWGSAPCPLPSHKPGDKDKTFQVSISGNYFKCWSASCNEKAGVKGGDCINLVALHDGISQYDAAKKLSEWFGIGIDKRLSTETKLIVNKAKTAPHIGARKKEDNTSKGTVSNNDSPAVAVNYMASIDTWFDETFKPFEGESEMQYWTRLRKSVKSQLVLSYKAGQKSR